MLDEAVGGRSRACAFFVFLTMVVAACCGVARAADGDLDLSFGGSGRLLTDFSATDEYGQAVVVQPDGKILIAGQSGIYPLFHSAFVRFNRNGTADTTFGTGGKTVIPLDPNGDCPSAVAIQADGKIVVAGSQLHDNSTLGIIVARLNPNGTLDGTFGNGGSVIFDFGDLGAEGTSVVIQPDGKILVAGITGTTGYGELTDIVVIRFNTDGTFDNTYGSGGRVRTHFEGQDNTGSRAWGAALQPDGRLVVAGRYRNEGQNGEFALARYNIDGSLDQSFGIGGMVHTRPGTAEMFAFDVAVQPDGKIVAAGYQYTAHHNHDFAVARYDPNGVLDTTFGTNGIVIADLFGTSDDIAYAMSIQTNGRIVVAGRTGQYPNFRPGILRLNVNGTYDTTFGAGGKVMSDFGGSAQLYGCALQTNGRIIVAGYQIGSTADMLVARYMSSAVTRWRSTDLELPDQ
jgi:uncharacterized delta-60 repeat protein